MDQVPVLPPPSPLFRNVVYHGQIQHFQQAVIGGKDEFGFCCLARLAVKALNGVGGVEQSAHLLGVLKIGAEIGPVDPSGLGGFRTSLDPALPKGVQSTPRCLFVYSDIDRFQVGHKCLQFLVGHILLEFRSWWMIQF